jgi:hypothetical protein
MSTNLSSDSLPSGIAFEHRSSDQVLGQEVTPVVLDRVHGAALVKLEYRISSNRFTIDNSVYP